MAKRDHHIRAAATLRNLFAVMFAIGLLAGRGSAQSSPRPANGVEVWRGISICLVKPSACHDEVVVYRVTHVQGRDSVTLDARKIVNAQEEEMGILGCRVAAGGVTFICKIPNGTWGFTIRGDSLVGELRLLDDTKFRDVRAARSR